MSLHQEPHHDLLGDLLHRIMGVVIFRDQSAKGADETGEWMMFTRGAAIKQLIHDSHCFVSRVYLNGRAAISPEMALGIEAWLGADRGGDALIWLAEQGAYDMWQAEQRCKSSPMQVQPAPHLLVAA